MVGMATIPAPTPTSPIKSLATNPLPWTEWRESVSEKDANITWGHIARSPNCSIRKEQRLLDYQAGYTSLEAVRESVAWLEAHGMIQT